jgi:N-acetyl-gamma-glutamyl-phosphate reductase
MVAPPRLRAAVAGATGYIGIQCVEMLARHPHVELVRLLARTHAGKRFSEVVPGSRVDLRLDPGLDVDGVDVVLAALPHTVAASHARGWMAAGAVVVDMSADFRLRDPRTWSQWYRLDHPDPELCAGAVYALPELPGRSMAGANLLAVPGCYPTAALLACVPALAAGMVEPDLVVDAKSGVRVPAAHRPSGCTSPRSTSPCTRMESTVIATRRRCSRSSAWLPVQRWRSPSFPTWCR